MLVLKEFDFDATSRFPNLNKAYPVSSFEGLCLISFLSPFIHCLMCVYLIISLRFLQNSYLDVKIN